MDLIRRLLNPGGGPARLPETMRGFVRPREGFVPAYVATYESGALEEKVEQALDELKSCRVCPRDCDVDRLADRKAVCRTGRHALVASAFPHFGEEDCLRGWNGSGTIFFAACNLRCVFCQNSDISWQPNGKELDAEGIADLMLDLQRPGLSQRQLRHSRSTWRRRCSKRSTSPPFAAGLSSADRLQHQRLRLLVLARAPGRCGRHLHAGPQILRSRASPNA